MEIFDISQELFSGTVYLGDLKPSVQKVCAIENGEDYNLSNLSMCLHNATHIDAPSHYIKNGKTVDEIDLQKCIGDAFVVEWKGIITAKTVKNQIPKDCKRLLIKGNCVISLEAAKAFVDFKLDLIGVEISTVGEGDEEQKVHRLLLENEMIIIENLVLKNISEGKYFLYAVPLKLGKCEASPCRAILIC